jgi:hypothetical protein
VNSGQLPDPQCKNTVAQTSAGLVHGGSHSARARTNVSALFSTDAGKSALFCSALHHAVPPLRVRVEIMELIIIRIHRDSLCFYNIFAIPLPAPAPLIILVCRPELGRRSHGLGIATCRWLCCSAGIYASIRRAQSWARV